MSLSQDKEVDESEYNCEFCNGYYGPTSGGPVCNICHNFIFDSESTVKKGMKEDKDTSDDSGNEDGEEKQIAGISESLSTNPNHYFDNIRNSCISYDDVSIHCSNSYSRLNSIKPGSCHSGFNNNHNYFLSTTGLNNSSNNNNCLELLPTEILLKIIDKLDDIALWSLRFTSTRLRAIVDSRIPDDRWSQFIQQRWPLHRNHVPDVCYRDLYSNFLQSMACRTCWERLWDNQRIEPSPNSSTKRNDDSSAISLNKDGPYTWFNKRVRLESRILSSHGDAPYGIMATCLDSFSYSSWMAAITGPTGSPYEGGLFYLHVRIPTSYPLQPPHVRFLTRICHPNISKHGDIGLDLLHNNWSLALTISKLLISIQSLLTDPNPTVCMEPQIGALYSSQPHKFKQLSRLCTWKYAMHDYLPPSIVENINIL